MCFIHDSFNCMNTTSNNGNFKKSYVTLNIINKRRLFPFILAIKVYSSSISSIIRDPTDILRPLQQKKSVEA